MADLNKFEEMLERLINEDKEGAQELFHEIVVEKSRDIYESLLAEEADEDEEDEKEVDEAADEEVDESEDDLEEGFDLEEFEVEADPMDMDDMGGDTVDDMMGDMEPKDDMGDMGGEDDMEDRVEDLEDALDELKKEFEAMMSGEDGDGDDEGDDMDDMGDMGDMGDDEGDDEKEEESYAFEAEDEDKDDEKKDPKKDPKSDGETMREYVEKINATMGDNGQNTKSTVAGKNDMGGTASNLNQSKEEKGVEANKGALQGNGLGDANPKDMSTGNVNVPGGKASKSMKAQPKGHGAEKKGAGEGSTDSKPVIGN